MIVEPLDADLRAAYLRHLGVDGQLGAPSAAGLRALHHAQLDHVPYENLEIQLGRSTTIDPAESASRIVTGRGGYCFHLNGAFGALLASLGYQVMFIRGAVPDGDADERWGTHMVLRIELDGTTWLADVGLGDGFRDPLPLVPGEFDQRPFRYALSDNGADRWRFHHDPRATITGFDLNAAPVGLAAFTTKHSDLSRSPNSPFVQKLVVQSRRSDHTLILRGCVLTRTGGSRSERRDIDQANEWFQLLAEEFGLRLDDVDEAARDVLWARIRSAHEAWVRAGRP